MDSGLRIPQQFKPKRAIENGPFAHWVNRMIKRTDLTMQDLEPTAADLELISKLAYQRDKVGDRLAALIMRDRKVYQQLDQALEQGLESLNDPAPELVEFVRHYEELPEWSYLNDLREFIASSKGEGVSVAKKSAPRFFLDGFAMAGGFFIGANYPAVGHSIVSTGSVASGSMRMKQTMQYVDDMMDVKEFELHGKALRSNAKVRLAHAFARIQIERSGLWDEDYYGEIISEFDNMIFLSGLTFLSVFAGQFGIGDRGKKALEIQIKAMQYLLGAPKEIVTMSLEENMRFFTMVVAHLDDSPRSARQVVRSFHDNEYFRPTDTLKGRIERELSFLLANLFCRTFWGNGMADEIGLEDSYRGIPLSKLCDFVANPPASIEKATQVLMQSGVKLSKFLRGNPNAGKARGETPVATKQAADDQGQTYKGSFNQY